MATSRVTTKGQVTIPKQVRDALRVRPGDEVDFVLGDDGEVRLRAARFDARDLKGLLRRPNRKPVSLEAMEEAILRRGTRR